MPGFVDVAVRVLLNGIPAHQPVAATAVTAQSRQDEEPAGTRAQGDPDDGEGWAARWLANHLADCNEPARH